MTKPNALVRDPRILVLDEATSAVENETESRIQHQIGTVTRGRMMRVIAHRLGPCETRTARTGAVGTPPRPR